MRGLRLEGFYQFGHDQDLYSWIVKDMWVDGNFRLIGQLTSFDGVYIGPFFYYLLVPFFAISRMDPLGATVPAAMLGVLTVWSFYSVFSQIANKKVGLVAAAIYAVSPGNVFFDRWVVPTQPTVLWAVWYLWGSFLILKGKTRGWIWIGGLFGLIWHIHIALLPLIPVSLSLLAFKKSRPDWRIVAQTLGIFFLVSAPFWLFELRHGFIQTRAFIGTTSESDTSAFPQGWERLIWVLERIGFSLRGNLFSYSRWVGFWNVVPFVIVSGYVIRRKLLKKPLVWFIFAWTGLVLVAQLVSPKGVSEYYFMNITPLFLLLLSVVLVDLFKKRDVWLVGLLGIFSVWHIFNFLLMPDLGDGYLAKKNVVDAIKMDVEAHNYPCASITYIANPGMNVGFRYLFWWRDVYLIEPGRGAPIYNIFVGIRPAEDEQVDFESGDLYVQFPEEVSDVRVDVCTNSENQLQPLLGFVN